MLVLSRKQDETILFPNLNIEIQIARIAGKIVRVGIDAPNDVRILRGELADEESRTPQASSTSTAQVNRHALRNQLNNAMLGLQVLQAKIDAGQADDAEPLIMKVFQSLSEINDGLEAVSGPTSDKSQRESNVEHQPNKSQHALIVDDSHNEATLLAQFLQLQGYESHIVHDGAEALRWLERNTHPDVVLMDINMPGMDGATTIRHIRRERRFDDVQLFGLSGLSQEEVNLEPSNAGVDRWFQKPVNASEVAQAIGNHRRHRVSVN